MMIFLNDEGIPVGLCRRCGKFANVDMDKAQDWTLILEHEPPEGHFATLMEWPAGLHVRGYRHPVNFFHDRKTGIAKAEVLDVPSYRTLCRSNHRLCWDIRACEVCRELMKRENPATEWDHFGHWSGGKEYDHEARIEALTSEEAQAYHQKFELMMKAETRSEEKALGLTPIRMFLKAGFGLREKGVDARGRIDGST